MRLNTSVMNMLAEGYTPNKAWDAIERLSATSNSTGSSLQQMEMRAFHSLQSTGLTAYEPRSLSLRHLPELHLGRLASIKA